MKKEIQISRKYKVVEASATENVTQTKRIGLKNIDLSVFKTIEVNNTWKVFEPTQR